MPIKKRHKVHAFGAITAGNQTTAIEMSEFTSAIVYVDRAGVSGTVATVQTSPDGASWHDLYDEQNTKIEVTVAATSRVAFIIPVSGQFMRVAITVQDADGVWIEGIREIA